MPLGVDGQTGGSSWLLLVAYYASPVVSHSGYFRLARSWLSLGFLTPRLILKAFHYSGSYSLLLARYPT